MQRSLGSIHTELVKGWFEDTLQNYKDLIGPIAILRIDGDWYSSVRCCLDNLYDSVVQNGFIILDDYYAYDGCAVATHAFLGERMLPHRIESVHGFAEGYDVLEGALFRKGATPWYESAKWMDRVDAAIGDIEPSPGRRDYSARRSAIPPSRCIWEPTPAIVFGAR